MALDKKEIIELLKNKGLQFSPMIDGWQLQPNGIDLRAGYNFYIPKAWEYTEKGRIAANVDYMDYENHPEAFQMLKLKPGQYFEILPQEFILISTLEKITFNENNLLAIIYARTSMMRRGLLIGDGVVDIKYSGSLIIPIINNTSNQVIRIYPGERMCQLIFHRTGSGLDDEEAIAHGLNKAKYQDSTAQNVEFRHDKRDEIDLIKKGQLDKLKASFKVEDL
ncbi:hypothetical protein C4544_02975 [candidate division WS5 bacterium]|uniref:Uncharacterized protein n=1 Tax=candidate division WS5 bacterium TaxID=2093353 RepID=A0A419DE82_9BACT|nr:MAG: hypothetical protein C4544_02975 [candidate division WS5 bacterium]